MMVFFSLPWPQHNFSLFACKQTKERENCGGLKEEEKKRKHDRHLLSLGRAIIKEKRRMPDQLRERNDVEDRVFLSFSVFIFLFNNLLASP